MTTRTRLPSRHNQARLKAAVLAKQRERHLQAQAIVATGKCPQCGAKLRRNLALAGWFQCSQFGAEGFRADAARPSCSFQTFTE
jgi:hypothetical protein